MVAQGEEGKTMSLTEKLLATHGSLQEQATQHDFLKKAGEGTLPSSTLCAWLVQDTHYTRAYVRFVGGLMSKLTIPVRADAFLRASENDSYLHARIFNALSAAMGVIGTEMHFFEDTARKYDLPLDWDADVEDATREYKKLFEAKGVANGSSLLDGLVVLWATEWCYFKAWTFALEHQTSGAGRPERGDNRAVAALHEAFIPNWTSDPFAEFVKECGDVVDALADEEGVDQVFDRCENVFKTVLELEIRFWPA